MKYPLVQFTIMLILFVLAINCNSAKDQSKPERNNLNYNGLEIVFNRQLSLIDSTILLLQENAKLKEDSKVAEYYLIEKGIGEEIRLNSLEIRNHLFKNLRTEDDKCDYLTYVTPDPKITERFDDPWLEYLFKEMPVRGALPILKKWHSDNLKVHRCLFRK